jgi:MFS family permease
VLAATIIGSSMAFIDGTVVNVALPALQACFHATVTDVQWVVASYGLFLAALILVGGSLGDLFGRRLVFLFGVTIFAAASVGCGISQWPRSRRPRATAPPCLPVDPVTTTVSCLAMFRFSPLRSGLRLPARLEQP